MKKNLKLMLVAVLAGVMFIPSVSALDVKKYGTAIDITKSGHPTDGNYQAVVVTPDATNQNLVFNLGKTSLKAIDKSTDSLVERTVDDAAWFGVGISAPGSGDGNDLAGLDPEFTDTLGNTKALVLDGSGISAGMYTVWVPISAQDLKEKVAAEGPDAVLEKTFTIYWDKTDHSKNTQTITVRVKASDMTIVPDTLNVVAENSTWNEAIYNEAVKDYEEAHTPKDSATTEVKNDEKNPNTSDMNIYALLTIMFVSGFGVVYTVKRRYN